MHYQSSGAFLSLLRGKKKERESEQERGKKKTFSLGFLMKIKGSRDETKVILKKKKKQISLHVKGCIVVSVDISYSEFIYNTSNLEEKETSQRRTSQPKE